MRQLQDQPETPSPTSSTTTANDPTPDMAHGKHISGFRILAEIGAGAASTLYAVQDPKSKQVWALKYVEKHSEKDERFIEQTEAEYQVGSKLDHKCIRKIERLIRHRKMFKLHAVSLLMELIDALPMDKRLPRNHRQAIDIFHQVAIGLAHMHKRGFVHADIKPANILVTEDSKAKIIDLGQACPVGTVKKRIQGTPGYMAPEQAHRQAITPRTDVYNLGATMYWVLVREVIPTAMPPKDEVNSLYGGAVDANMVSPPVPPHEKNSRIHPLLSQQIMDCVKIHPDERPESMEVVANRLELIGDLLDNPPQAPPPLIGDEDTVF